VFHEDEIKMTWSEFLSHIRSHHLKLEHLFGTGIGLKFQRIDSDIAALCKEQHPGSAGTRQLHHA
jgi:hypothetical protein